MDNKQWRAVYVPTAVIRNTDIPIAARFIYMVMLAAAPAGTTACHMSMRALVAASGFGSDHTVRRNLRLLTEASILTVTPGRGARPSYFASDAIPKSKAVPVSVNLLYDSRLSPAAKLLYALLVSMRQREPALTLSQRDLAARLGMNSAKAVRVAITQLREGGWLRTARVKGRAGTVYEPYDPDLALRVTKAEFIQELIGRTRPKGEFILKKMLDELVLDETFQDNAKPGFLRNPLTGERMEFDRWYTEAAVAIEFQGIQHYRATADVTAKDVRAQQARDLMKLALATKKRIRLVTAHGGDLKFGRLKSMLKGLLPLRELRAEDPVVQMLAVEGRRYAGG